MRNILKTFLFCFIIYLVTACQPNPYRQGHVLYQIHCENCHMEDGSGLPGLIPSLGKYTKWDSRPDSVVCLIRNGVPLIKSTGQMMPPNRELNAVEISNLLNYLRSLYLKKAPAVKVSEIESWSAGCQ